MKLKTDSVSWLRLMRDSVRIMDTFLSYILVAFVIK